MEQTLTYTGINGRFSTADITLATDFTGDFDVTDSYNLPLTTGITLDTTHATFTGKVIDKDSRERLGISYIIHHIDESGKVYVNRGWAKRNGLIGGNGFTGLKVQWTYGKPNGTSEKTTAYGTAGTAQTANFVIDDTSIRITPQANPGGGVAWSVIDEDNNILFWVDETTANPLYLNFRSTY